MMLDREPVNAAPAEAAAVVVTAAGTATAYGLVRALRDRWGGAVRIVGTDTNPPALVAASTLLDACHQVPTSDSGGFAAALDAVLTSEAPAVYVPLIDAEIVLAAEREEEGSLPEGISLLGPGTFGARICLDKLAVARELRRAAVSAASTSSASTAEWSPGGVVVKPRRGFGSAGVRTYTERAAFEADRASFTDADIAQPLLVGPETTIDVFAAADGSVRAVARERLETRGGVATKARVYEDPAMVALASNVAAALRVTGLFCFQVMCDADGAILVTDVNARAGGGTRMTVAAGVDLLCAPFAEHWNLPLPLPPLPAERFVVRHWEEDVRCG